MKEAFGSMGPSIRRSRRASFRRIESARTETGAWQWHRESPQLRCVPAGAKIQNGAADRRVADSAKRGGHEIRTALPFTIGELIVELTEEARRYCHTEQELYEVVAYLLDQRLKRRARSEQFLKMMLS